MKQMYFGCLLLLSFFFSYQAIAQRIYFSDTTNKWRWTATHAPDGVPNTRYWLTEAQDSVVEWNGNLYTFLVSEDDVTMDALIRDDTAANRVYIKPMNLENGYYFNFTDTNEFVYMDYNLEVGDSMIMPLVYTWEVDDSTSIHKVFEVDSVLIENIWYKRFYMVRLATSDQGFEEWYTTIEGIGPLPVLVGEATPELMCFSNQGVIPSIFYQHCFSVSVKDLDKPDVLFNIYPIPAKNQLTISLNKAMVKNYQVQIINLFGQVLVEELFQKQVILNLDRYSSGIYLLRIFAGGQLLQSDKLCISK